MQGGVLFIAGTIGRGGRQLAHVRPKSAVDAAGDCAFFAEVDFEGSQVMVTKVAADHGVFACLDEEGALWAWASQPFGPVQNTPRKIPAAAAIDVAVGGTFVALVHHDGTATAITAKGPIPIATAEPATRCDAAHNTLFILAGTALYQLQAPTFSTPTPLTHSDAPVHVSNFSCGSIHSAACTPTGDLYTWGFNQSGCLGTGNRSAKYSFEKPYKVEMFGGETERQAVSVGCTKGQPMVASSKGTGQEGPRTHVVTRDGRLYIAGTTHKGMGADHMHKTFMPKSDHLTFYMVGGKAADVSVSPPVPTGAAEDFATQPELATARMGMGGPQVFGAKGHTGYLSGASMVSSTPAHIHSAALSAKGELFTWGCGSNGRTGLAAFLRGPGGSKRTMKCYVSTPSRVESLENYRVLSYAVGRWWTLAIVDPASLPKKRRSSARQPS